MDCKKEMQCEKNGVVVTWGESHSRNGDTYKCKCGARIGSFIDKAFTKLPEVESVQMLDGELKHFLIGERFNSGYESCDGFYICKCTTEIEARTMWRKKYGIDGDVYETNEGNEYQLDSVEKITFHEFKLFKKIATEIL